MEIVIPKPVMKEAGELVAQYGEHFELKGKYKKYDVYMFVFPENTETGFPFIYLYDPSANRAYEMTGFEALEILSRTK